MSIIGTFPTTIQNGTTEDAVQVMTLFAYIQSQTNGNACPATTGTAILKGNGSGGTAAAAAGTDYLAAQPGMVFDFAGTAAPSGYLVCDGSAVSRATYAALFTAIGTTWGAGDGSTTFNLPDLRRRTTIGAGGTAVAGPANTVGAVGGEETHVLTVAELAAHNHGANVNDPSHAHGNSLNDPGHSHTIPAPSGVGGTPNLPTLQSGTLSAIATNSSNTGMSINNASATTGIGVTVNSNGSGTAHNTMQPSAVVTKIIKT